MNPDRPTPITTLISKAKPENYQKTTAYIWNVNPNMNKVTGNKKIKYTLQIEILTPQNPPSPTTEFTPRIAAIINKFLLEISIIMRKV